MLGITGYCISTNVWLFYVLSIYVFFLTITEDNDFFSVTCNFHLPNLPLVVKYLSARVHEFNDIINKYNNLFFWNIIKLFSSDKGGTGVMYTFTKYSKISKNDREMCAILNNFFQCWAFQDLSVNLENY